jgi:rhomboid protease GluP
MLCYAVTMDPGSQILLRVTGDLHLAEEWELVLLAQGLSPSLRRSPDGVVLSVPEAEVDRALASLSAYEQENPRKVAEHVEPMEAGSVLAGIAVALMLLLFFVTVQWLPALSWFERGSADAQLIIQGELWRTVTALTLHADAAHALSNAVAAALFFSAVSSMVGAGLGGALVLLAGAGGNLANAFLHGSPHIAVGASTAVFGAVGMLGSLGMIRRRRRALSRWRVWLPVAASLALLGMLGSGGERIDIWAHFFGLLIGSVLGILIALVKPRPPGLPTQWTCGASAVAVLIYCWTLAFR